MTAAGVDSVVFHLALHSDWSAALASAAGEYRVSTLGRTLEQEGFIHASFAHQVAGVLARFYTDVSEPLVLLRLDAAALPVMLEPAVPGSPAGTPGAELYPHIYGPIVTSAALDVLPDPRGTDGERILAAL